MTQREDSLSSSNCIRLVQKNIEKKMNTKFWLVHSSQCGANLNKFFNLSITFIHGKPQIDKKTHMQMGEY